MRKALLTMLYRRCTLLLIVILTGSIMPRLSHAQEVASEYQVKATFLYKFTSYVDWPDSAFDRQDAPLMIGVIDADDVEQELSRLVAGRRIKNHALLVRHLEASEPLTANHVLFIGKGATNRLGRILDSVKSRPVLTVTEYERLPEGSVINFVLVDDQVRFQVSLVTAAKNNLKISSRLLSVAQQVVTEEP